MSHDREGAPGAEVAQLEGGLGDPAATAPLVVAPVVPCAVVAPAPAPEPEPDPEVLVDPELPAPPAPVPPEAVHPPA